jgi:replication-associated recombination protein RarA
MAIGKTTIARLYAAYLGSVGVLPGACFKETTGAALAHAGVSGCQSLIDDILNEGGGVLFIDESYQMTSGHSAGGKAVLENLTGKIVFVLAGYNKEMESFFSHNPGLPSRFPITMKFDDYNDKELLNILQMKIHKLYNGRMQFEGGGDGLFCRIVAARVGRGRGRKGFGNARTIENVIAQILARQANRLRKEHRRKKKPDDLLLTKKDLIGPEPSNALQNSAAWKDLNQLIGLQSVKEAVKALVVTLQQNYLRELAEQPITEYSLNKVFLGNPGTGKTTVAKIYGKILAELGMLSRGEGTYCSQSEFSH